MWQVSLGMWPSPLSLESVEEEEGEGVGVMGTLCAMMTRTLLMSAT